MKLSDAYRLVKEAIKSNTPVMLWGPPGIGKSDVIWQIGTELSRRVLDLRLAQIEPTDLRGVPMPNQATGRSQWYLPDLWPNRALKATTRAVETVDDIGNIITTAVPVKAGCCPDGPGILFLDEIEKAPVSVKNASLQLVLNRMIGTYKLPDDWAIVCAGNNEEDACFSAPMGKALENRMIHLPITVDIDVWAAWAREHDIAEDIIGFLYLRPELLYKQTNDHAFPSPRSWAMASNLIKAVSSQKEQSELLTASVGAHAKGEFVVWQNVYKNVDPEAIFNGIMPSFSGKENDQSFKYAVALSFAFHLRKRKEGIRGAEEHIVKFLKLLSPELRVLSLKNITNGKNLHILESMAANPMFRDMVKEFAKSIV